MDKPRAERLVPIEGQPPDLARPGAGCAFQPRCSYAVAQCAGEKPKLDTVFEGHDAACFRSAHL